MKHILALLSLFALLLVPMKPHAFDSIPTTKPNKQANKSKISDHQPFLNEAREKDNQYSEKELLTEESNSDNENVDSKPTDQSNLPPS